MPALTRGAAARLRLQATIEEQPDEADDAAEHAPDIALRQSVTGRADSVWSFRNERDAYTLATRADTQRSAVDHCLEIQLVEMAFVRAIGSSGARAGSAATAQAAAALRDRVNAVTNLNVTSAKVNNAKRGPFTAALNRLEKGRLRAVTIEQLARQGKAKWLVDEGHWARIGSCVVQSYEATDAWLREGERDALPGSNTLVDATMDELQSIMQAVGIMER